MIWNFNCYKYYFFQLFLSRSKSDKKEAFWKVAGRYCLHSILEQQYYCLKKIILYNPARKISTKISKRSDRSNFNLLYLYYFLSTLHYLIFLSFLINHYSRLKGVICHAGIKLWDTWWAENADLNRVWSFWHLYWPFQAGWLSDS